MNMILQHEHIIIARPRPVLATRSRLILAAMLATVIVHGVGLVILGGLWQTRSMPLPPPPLEINLITRPQQAALREVPPPPKPVVRAQPPTPTTPPMEATEEPIMPTPVSQPVVRESEPVRQVQAPTPLPPVETRTEPADAPPVPVAPPSFNAAYLNNPSPPYPPRARKLGLQGTVVLRVAVNPAGRPEQINILTSSGVSLLDETAINTVRQWTFAPARQGDHAVAGVVNVPIRFVLN